MVATVHGRVVDEGSSSAPVSIHGLAKYLQHEIDEHLTRTRWCAYERQGVMQLEYGKTESVVVLVISAALSYAG